MDAEEEQGDSGDSPLSCAESQHGAKSCVLWGWGYQFSPLLPRFAPGRLRAGPRLGMVPTEGTVLRQLRLPTAGL